MLDYYFYFGNKVLISMTFQNKNHVKHDTVVKVAGSDTFVCLLVCLFCLFVCLFSLLMFVVCLVGCLVHWVGELVWLVGG